ncbi:MAG: hypothetical protein L0Y71_18840 [Gemmataceae bacterium]|nr:hypothetical protein [Gemmataceae bacterium]
MIWFACPKCRKVHGRPDNAGGAMIFCDCGQGLTVPWESTAAEPSAAPAVVVPPAGRESAGRGEPLSFGGAPEKPMPVEPLPPVRASRRRARYEHDPNVCLNHETRPKQKVCVECGMSFCDDCVVTFRGQALCGPCKNYEARLLQQPPRTSGLALASVLMALAAGPLMFCLLSVGASRGFVLLTLFALAPQVMAFLAGLFALRRAQADPRVGGQPLAITGIVTASFTAVLTMVLTLYAPRVGA